MSPGRRRNVFDPHRLDDLDDLLPPAPPPVAEPSGETPPEPAPRIDTYGSGVTPTQRASQLTETVEPESLTPVPRQPRGQGGRPTSRRTVERVAEDVATTSRFAVAVRVPPVLYNDVNNDLLAGPERPSYGQLVIWTCEDYQDDVIAAIQAARPKPGERRPRGHTLAAEGVQITLRLTKNERDFVDSIAQQARPSMEQKAVTRTEVAAAALKVALATQPE